MDIFAWLETTPIANAIRTIPWIYPALETSHYIGLAMLVGGIMLIDLRPDSFGERATSTGWEWVPTCFILRRESSP